jgi:hypothetical protein
VVDVFTTILSRCKDDGIARVSIPFLSSITWHEDGKQVTVEEMENIIRILESPDPQSRSLNDEGRRIRRVDGGFNVINHQKYRKETVKDYFKKKQRETRAKAKKGAKPPSPKPRKPKTPKDFIPLGNGNKLPFSFFQKLATYCGDKDQAAHIIYRAKDKETPMAWITDGLKKENAYALVACADEEKDPQKVRAWIDKNIFRYPEEGAV